MQCWQILACNLPNEFIVNAGVAMDHSISHVIHGFPWHLFVSLCKVWKLLDDLICRFTDDFQVSHHAVLQQARLQELGFRHIGKLQGNLLNGLNHVGQVIVEPDLLQVGHTGWACSIT